MTACTSICSSRQSSIGRRSASRFVRRRSIPNREHTALTVVDSGASARSRFGCGSRVAPTAHPRSKLNGNALDASAAPGSYLTITRAWKAGDRVEMELPMHLHVEAMPDEPGTQAFLYGPLVLAGDLGNDGLTEAHIVGPNLRVGAAGVEQHGSPLGPVNQTPPIPDIEIPTFRAAGGRSRLVDQGGRQPRTFRTVGQKKDVTLVPLNRLFDRRYSVYWRVS